MSKNDFKPFLVESSRDHWEKNIFRVERTTGKATQEQIKTLLENLPIAFSLGLDKESSEYIESVNEALMVSVEGYIIYIYPPRGRVNYCTTLDRLQPEEVISQFRVDNTMDLMSPGKGQIRTCFHFNPRILGINDLDIDEIEVDIFVYPKTKTQKIIPKIPSIAKVEVVRFLDLVAGGPQKSLTNEQLEDWRELIMFLVTLMRAHYENPDIFSENDKLRLYYKKHWEEIDAAKDDDNKLISALSNLASAIEMQ